MRVFELARELGMDSKGLLALCEEIGIEGKKNLSSLTDEEAERLREAAAPPVKAEKKRAKEAPPAKAGKPKAPERPHEPSPGPEAVVSGPVKEKPAPLPEPSGLPEEETSGKTAEAAPPGAEEPTPVAEAPLRRVEVDETVTVGQLAEKLGVKPNVLIVKLMELGVLATINQRLDQDAAQLVGLEFGAEVVFRPVEEEALEEMAPEADRPEDLVPRPPVVTVMGHVDHGKTTLLDAIRNTNVAGAEHGQITQHIGAYEVRVGDRTVTFLDTPGHELFTAMRARGAQVTDIVVLVVAADDGVMPQTVEAINHSREAGVPVIVAVNKCDLPGADPDRVVQQLMAHGLVAERYGGDTVVVPVSALRNQGVDELLEMVLLQADMLELKANPKRRAVGTVIEARLDRGKGPVGTVLVQNGTLRVGDAFVAGLTAGKVRSLMNDRGQFVKEATLSQPVEVAGFSEVPQAGDIFQVVESERRAREIVNARRDRARAKEQAAPRHMSLKDLHELVERGEVKELRLIVKGDVQGTVEAVCDAVAGLSTDEIQVKIVHSGVGPVSESDVVLAEASDAIIIAMHVGADAGAEAMAKQNGVEVRTYRIIYDCIDDVRRAMQGLLEPERVEIKGGRALVRKLFKISRLGIVAGCMVTEGKVARNMRARVLRGDQVVADGLTLASLKRHKDDVREVASGAECGIRLDGFDAFQEGDIIETYTVEARERTL